MDQKEFYSQLVIVPYILIGLCLFIGMVRFKKLSNTQRLLFWLILATVITETVSEVLWRKEMNNFPVFHFYAIIEFSLIFTIYYRALYPSFSNKFLYWTLGGFLGFAIFNALFLQSLFTANSNVTTLSSVILVVLSLLYFYKTLKDSKLIHLEKSIMFWVSTGVLIYFSSSLVLFTFGNLLVSESISDTMSIWVVHVCFNIFYYSLLSIALWVRSAN